ncbi:MAG: hypothetical protein M1826_003554 [Phylliscum demangeonii]|nr:MAG: hypothetical protein M1826_003554 [Phylliscum demangeonii]
MAADLKNTTDDALPNYLNSLKFQQSHFYADVRHALGFSAVAIAAATFYFDYTLGWEKTKSGTLWAVLMYFLLNGALAVWMSRHEQGCIYMGKMKDTEVLVKSRVEKLKPTYFLSVQYRQSSSGHDWTVVEAEASFTRWFDEQGHFVTPQFQQWLATAVPVIGAADARSVIPRVGESEEGQKGTSSVLKTGLEGSPVVASGSRRREKGEASARGGNRSKKAP